MKWYHSSHLGEVGIDGSMVPRGTTEGIKKSGVSCNFIIYHKCIG